MAIIAMTIILVELIYDGCNLPRSLTYFASSSYLHALSLRKLNNNFHVILIRWSMDPHDIVLRTYPISFTNSYLLNKGKYLVTNHTPCNI